MGNISAWEAVHDESQVNHCAVAVIEVGSRFELCSLEMGHQGPGNEQKTRCWGNWVRQLQWRRMDRQHFVLGPSE